MGVQGKPGEQVEEQKELEKVTLPGCRMYTQQNGRFF